MRPDISTIKILPEGWQRLKLGDVCFLKTGGTPSKGVKEYWDGGTISWLVSGDINKEFIYEVEGKITKAGLESANTKILPINSVLIALNGQGKTRGKVAVLKTESTCNQSIVAIIPKDEKQLNYMFLFYYLKASYQKLRNMTGDNERSGLSMRILKEFGMAIPSSIDEQLKIASNLYSQMVQIEAIKKESEKSANASLLIQTQILNKFFMSEEAKKWGRRKLGDICELQRGSSPRPKGDPKYYGGKIPRLLIADVTRDGKYVNPAIDTLTEEGAKLSRPMKKGTVVMAVSGAVGLPAILKVDACIHDGFVGMSNLSEDLVPEYLYYLLLFQRNANSKEASGAIWKNLTTDQIKNFSIPIPSFERQVEMVKEMNVLFTVLEELVAFCQTQLSSISMLPLSILNDVFGGKMVSEASWIGQ